MKLQILFKIQKYAPIYITTKTNQFTFMETLDDLQLYIYLYLPLEYILYSHTIISKSTKSAFLWRPILTSPSNKQLLITYYMPTFANFIQGTMLVSRPERQIVPSIFQYEVIWLSFLEYTKLNIFYPSSNRKHS